MEMIALILSGLALLAAGVCLCLLMQKKKRNQERNAAEKELRGAIDWCIGAIGEETTHRVDACNKMVERIANLESGVIPDYEKATAAVAAVNDFNQGISNLLNYDPVSALAAQREKERQGG